MRAMATLVSKKEGWGVADALCVPFPVESSAAFDKLKDNWSKETIDLVNEYKEDVQGGIIARRFDLAIKYALIHSATTRKIQDIYEPLEAENLQWGMVVAKMLTEWKINKLFNRTTTGNFDRDLEYFKRAIAKTMQKGRAPSFKYMMNRNKKMKNWSKKYSEEIIQMLITRKEIIAVDQAGGKSTKYFLIEDECDDAIEN